MATIYMPLLDEQVDVWRPIAALHLRDDLYRVLGPVPDTEIWAFAPNTVVRCAPKTFHEGETQLVALTAA